MLKDDGLVLGVVEWKLSPDMQYMLVKANYKKVRWISNALIYSVTHGLYSNGVTLPLATTTFTISPLAQRGL